MEKQIKKEREAIVDFKGALDFYEHTNKGHRLSRKLLAEQTGVSAANMTNWAKKGNKMLGFLLTLHEQTGFPLEQIIKDVQEWKSN